MDKTEVITIAERLNRFRGAVKRNITKLKAYLDDKISTKNINITELDFSRKLSDTICYNIPPDVYVKILLK